MATPMIQPLSMYSVVKTISPDTASEWLDKHNSDNRRIRPNVVKALTSAIKRGEWELTHQGIAFDEVGKLLDGQHRLAAIAASGVAVAMSVSYNVPRSSFRAIDTHQKRSVEDVTNLSSAVVAVGAVFARVSLGKNTHRSAVIRAVEAMAPDAERLFTFCGTKRRGVTSAVAAGAIARAIESGNEDFCYGAYRALILQHFDAMTPLQQSFYKQITADVTWTKRHKIDPVTEAFSRACIAFDPASTLVRVHVRDFDAYRELATECLRKRGGL